MRDFQFHALCANIWWAAALVVFLVAPEAKWGGLVVAGLMHFAGSVVAAFREQPA